MPNSDFRSAQSWQDAINLGPGLVRLAEELPASEQMGLAWQLQKAMVALPAAIAHDLMVDGDYTRREVALKLIASMELIDKIYPALDTAGVRAQVDSLLVLLDSDSFSQVPATASAAVLPPAPEPAPRAIPMGPILQPPLQVPIVPEAQPAPPETTEPSAPGSSHGDLAPIQVPVQPQDEPVAPQENHVQPDSVQ